MVFEPKRKFGVVVPKISFAEWFLQQSRKLAAEGKLALVNYSIFAKVWADKGTEITYEELLRNGVRVATAFRAIGAKTGDVMAVVAKNSPELYSFVKGAILANINIAPSVFELSASELRQNFEVLKPRYILTRPDKAPVIQEAILDMSPRPEIILIDEKTLGEFLSRGSNANPDTFETAPVEDPATHTFLYMFSSGTTGKQKLFMLNSYRFLEAAATGAESFCKGKGLYMSISQLGWVLWFYQLTRCAMAGRPWLFTTATDVESILDFVHKYKPTSYYGPPRVVNGICNALENHPGRWDISSLKSIIASGEKLAADMQKKFSEHLKIDIYQEFGSTETWLITTADFEERPTFGSSGKLATPVRIVNPETEDEVTEFNKSGEIRVKTIMMSSYLGDPETMVDAFDKNGWYRTGDLGYLDEAGNLFVVDRIKELLKYNDLQVLPSELEEIISLIPGVGDVAVAGKKHPNGSLITAFIVKKPGANLTEKDIQNYMESKNLHDSKKLRGGVIFVDEIPKSSNGKILRRKLADYLNNTQ